MSKHQCFLCYQKVDSKDSHKMIIRAGRTGWCSPNRYQTYRGAFGGHNKKHIRNIHEAEVLQQKRQQ